MEKLKFITLGCFIPLCFPSCFSLECVPKVEHDYIYFDNCFNGMHISIVSFENNNYNPFHYEVVKEVAILANKDPDIYPDFDLKKIYYDKPLKHDWAWYCYDEIVKSNIKSDTLCYQFIPDTWYLFYFASSHFCIFVYVNNKYEFINYYHKYNV